MPRLTTMRPTVRTIGARTRSITTEVERLGSSHWEALRQQVFVRDCYLCVCSTCRETGRVRPASEVDHVRPLWDGGTHDLSNLQSINGDCHTLKTQREAGERARRTGGA